MLSTKLGWLVHLYTSLGLVANLFGLFALVNHNAQGFFLFNLLAIAIDGTDGFMARKLEVKKNIPEFDGALLDNIIDFLTFTFLPLSAVFFLNLMPLTQSNLFLISIPLIASSYGFCQTRAKTEDAFVGFPSYWNIVLIYFYLFQDHLSIAMMHGILIFLAIMVFVPIHYVYPTKTKRLFKTTMVLSSIYMIMITILCVYPNHPYAKTLGLFSLSFNVYYTVISLIHHKRVHQEIQARKME
jgi:phosphatidylcholine synthase